MNMAVFLGTSSGVHLIPTTCFVNRLVLCRLSAVVRHIDFYFTGFILYRGYNVKTNTILLYSELCLFLCLQIWARIPGSEDDQNSIPFEAFLETLKWWQYATVEKKVNCELLETNCYCTLHFLWDLMLTLFAHCIYIYIYGNLELENHGHTGGLHS